MLGNFNTAIVAIILVAMFGCKKNNEILPPTLPFVDNFDIAVPEPSGLTIALDGSSLWTVSDRNGTAYRISFEGEVLEELDFQLDNPDLEGITHNFSDSNALLAVDEKWNHILHINTATGAIDDTTQLNIEFDGGNGMEGITMDPVTRNLFLLQENNPKQIIELDSQFAVINIWSWNASDDLSGISCTPVSGEFWILSEASNRLFLWSTTDGILRENTIDMKKAEGIAVGPLGELYIVSDSQERLYVFEPGP
jgi:uncharacterized protein YjiK